MATNLSTAMRRFAPMQIRQLAPRPSTTARCLRLTNPYYSTEAAAPTTPPLLAQLKTDLKTAMRAKDAPRLAVLRNVIAETNNAAKTEEPITTDLQLVRLLRKTARANKEAAEEARSAGRDDLVEKEQAQIRVVDEYVAASGIKFMSEEEMRAVVKAAVEDAAKNGKPAAGVMKTLMTQSWGTDGIVVDKWELAKIAKETVGQKD